MLSVSSDRGPVHRRDFLRIGSLGLGGLSLPKLLATQAAGARSSGSGR